MSIVINGSGTISGISAGGLPDGCVTADDLASGVGGKVLQVVQGTKISSTASTTTNSSWVDTGVNVSITPSSSSSKVLILSHVVAGANNYPTTYASGLYTLQRNIGGGSYSLINDNTSVDGGGTMYGGEYIHIYNGSEIAAGMPFNFLDAPSTTSACNYKVTFRVQAGVGGSISIQKGGNLIAMEIAG